MSKTITYTDGAIITVRRPNGQTDEVIDRNLSRNGVIPADVFAKVAANTKGAGRGDVLGQRPNVVTAEVTLRMQREELTSKLADCAGAYPGTRAWHRGADLEKQLAAFDVAHPAVVAGLIAERDARVAPGVARALRMED